MISWLEMGLLTLNPEETKEPSGGYTRFGYSSKEQLAFNGFTHLAHSLGMNTRRDKAGNVIARWEGKDPSLPVLALGSHVDTVRNGGAYDGAAGVLAALAAVKMLRDEGYMPTRSIEVIAFACEESSRFGVATLGSKAMTGLLHVERVQDLRDEEGISMAEAFASQALDLSQVACAVRAKTDIHSFVELHIEQGPVLEQTGKDIGIVVGIASPLRLRVQVKGKAGHTGTSPMGKRKDALAAAAEIILYVEQIGEMQAMKYHLVATSSVVHAEPNVMNVIPDTVTLGIDIRSINDRMKDETAELVKRFCMLVESKRQIPIDIQELGNEPAVEMDATVIHYLTEAVHQAGYSMMRLVSGAGHDSMNMAQRWPTGMIFIPCREGISHHPDEHANLSDIYKGVQVLANYIRLVDPAE